MDNEQHHNVDGIFYRSFGPPTAQRGLVLFHGLASNSTRWSELARNLDLPDDWKLVCPDLRGHGRSAGRGRIGMEVWLNDLHLVRRHAGLGEAVIGGHCMGANLAIHAASKPEIGCLGCILIEPMLPVARPARLQRLARLSPLLGAGAWLVRIANRLGLRRRRLPDLDLFELDRQTRDLVSRSADATALTRRYASPRSDVRHIPVAAYLQSLSATLAPLPPMNQLHLPCLALLSSGGLFGDPQRTRSALKHIPAVEILELDAQHWIPTEQPEALRIAISTWLVQAMR